MSLTTEGELGQHQEIQVVGSTLGQDGICPVQVVVDISHLGRKLQAPNTHLDGTSSKVSPASFLVSLTSSLFSTAGKKTATREMSGLAVAALAGQVEETGKRRRLINHQRVYCRS